MNRHDHLEAIGALLTESEQAHGIYETTELHGVYDKEWPRWYAAYAVDHGIGALLGRQITTDELAEFLARTFDEFKGADAKPTESWAAWTARRIGTEP